MSNIFTVLMCVNKDNPFLDDAIQSVLSQTYIDFELIIVANNCDDNLFDKLKTYESDSRVILYRTSIGQLAFNLNYGVNLAKGEYIIRMDADDICYQDRLQHCREVIEEYDGKVDVIAFSADLIDEQGEIIGEIKKNDQRLSYKDFIYSNPIIHPATVIKKSTLIRHRGYLGGFQSEDLDLWIRLSKSADVNIISSSRNVLKYRISQQQSRGRLLPYCEVAGYRMRELLIDLSLKNLISLVISILKRYTRVTK